VGTVALHLPTEHHQPTGDGPQWLRVLRGCALLSKPAKAPVRLLTWTIDDSVGVEQSMERFLELQPDIIVINGTDDPAVGSRLGAALNGEVKFFPSDSTAGGMTAVVRGSFQYCGGDDDHWTMPLPSAQNGGGQGLITFPHVQDVGVFPLIITRLDTPSGINDWMEWGHHVISGAKDIADAASVIGTRKMVLMGDLQIPARSAPLATSIGKTGLRPIHSEPNWPTQVLGAPFLPLHARDQAWVGSGWHVQAARVLPSEGQIRAPIVFDLVPDTSKAP